MLFFLKNKLLIILCWIFLGLAASNIDLDLPRPLKSFVFVVDVTMSMNVEDKNIDNESVSRLEFTKKVLSGAIPGYLRHLCRVRSICRLSDNYSLRPDRSLRTFFRYPEEYREFNTGIIWAGDSEVSKGLFNALNLVGNIKEKVMWFFLLMDTRRHQYLLNIGRVLIKKMVLSQVLS